VEQGRLSAATWSFAAVLVVQVLVSCGAARPPEAGSPSDHSLGWSHRLGAWPVARFDALPVLEGGQESVTATTKGAVLVNVWASFCGPCRAEMGFLDRLDRSGVADVVGLNRDVRPRYAVDYLKDRPVSFPNVSDVSGDFTFSLHAYIPPAAIPSTILLVDGRISWVHVGPFRSYAELLDGVRARV